MSFRVGRPAEPIRLALIEQYGISKKSAQKLTDLEVAQLLRCKDDASRRLILGVSR